MSGDWDVPHTDPPPDSELPDAIITAKAGTDQMHAVYRDVWLPFFYDLENEMRTTGFSDQLIYPIIIDIHRKMIGLTEGL